MRRYRREQGFVYDEHDNYVCKIDSTGGLDVHRRAIELIPAMIDALRAVDKWTMSKEIHSVAAEVLDALKCECADTGYVDRVGVSVERCTACDRFATDAEARGFHLAHLVLSFDGVEATSDVLKARRAAHLLVEEVEARR